MKNEIELIFKIKNNFILPELLMRILFFLISFLNFKSISDDEIMEHHMYDFFWVAIAVNVFLVLLTIFFNYRRVLTLKRVIEIRTINIPKYQDATFNYSADYEYSNFGFFVAIQTITFFLSIVLIPFLITTLKNTQPDPVYLIYGLLITVAYFSSLTFLRKFFISNELQINDIILAGLDVEKIIKDNTFMGLVAKAKLIGWKRV